MSAFFNCSVKEFLDIADRHHLVCFGVSKRIDSFCEVNGSSWMKNIDFFVDNDKKLWGEKCVCGGWAWDVFSPEKLEGLKNAIIVISAGGGQSNLDIIHQIQGIRMDDSVQCCSLRMLKGETVYDNSEIENIGAQPGEGIEKKIHCCWFSNEVKPKKYQECIDSWKRYCPGYEIIEWNSTNYDISKNSYMKQAFEKKQWAFVSDYARLDLVYTNGGLYFDMDVEVLRSIDNLLNCDAFFSMDDTLCIDLGSGFGAKRNHPLIKKLLANYEGIDFIGPECKTDWTITLPQPARLIDTFKNYGFLQIRKSQIIDGVHFLSPDYIRIISDYESKSLYLTGTEYAIHRHNAGWVSQEYIDRKEKYKMINRELLTVFS